MHRSGTTEFADVGDYQASIREAKFNLVFGVQKDFEARLTRVELRYLRLLRGQENLPRVAHISLPTNRLIIAFSTCLNPSQIWDGVELQRDEIVFQSAGQGGHQWMRGPSQWGLISMAPERLSASYRALTGVNLVTPPVATIFRPSRVDATRLFRLHRKACRLAETNPELIVHPQVARAIEQDLLHALVNCLTSNNARKYSTPRWHHKKIIARFEEALAKHSEQQLKIPEICTLIGVSERTLRTCCAEFLGMSPSRYLRLLRLNMARAALQHAELLD